MPFTPFHLGPGAALKALLGRQMSFMVFGGAQVLMDLEPGIRMILGSETLHGPSHTLAGAAVIGAVAMATGRPVSHWVLARSGVAYTPMTWRAAGVGAFLGTFSHIALDALMHPDMHPWWPLRADNPWLALVSLDTLHWGCAALGVAGALGVAARWAWQRRAVVRGTAGDDLLALVREAVAEARRCGLDDVAQTLERAADATATTSSELIGDIGVALRSVRRSHAGRFPPVLEDRLARAMRAVRKVWIGFAD
jgi:hypothetical protein